jgi:hypothetical protein
MSETNVWELIFLMFVLKLPIAYLIGVVVWAIRALPEPEPPEPPGSVPAPLQPVHWPCSWRATRARPHPARRGSRRVVSGARR